MQNEPHAKGAKDAKIKIMPAPECTGIGVGLAAGKFSG
jgi:hypothetical protein